MLGSVSLHIVAKCCALFGKEDSAVFCGRILDPEFSHGSMFV